MDVVVKSALQKGILTSGDVSREIWDDGIAVDWRTLCRYLERGPSLEAGKRGDADRADTLRRFAADLYGFQSITICEVGTLVLAHLLRRRLSREVWSECFRLDCIPVAPHGKSLSSLEPLMLASPDPGRAAVRNLSRSVVPGASTLVYADRPVISALKSLLASELRYVASAVDNEPAAVRLKTTSGAAAA